MFSHAQNLHINGGTFNDVKGDFNHYHIQGSFLNNDAELGLHTLGQSASLGAIHDSSERYPPPNCHAETRLEVRELIMKWIEDPDPVSFILWLYGPAGVGKSAIMQSIAEQISQGAGNLGGSFFFSKGKPDRNQGRFLFLTIGYQLAFNIPQIRAHINNTMRSNLALPTKSIKVQLHHLIVESFRKLADSPHPTPTIILDALDECEDHEIQKLIVTLIHEAIVVHKLPLRFLIASRPEAHIREVFDQAHICTVTHRLTLDETFQPNRDIEKYLCDGFETIYDSNPQVMAHVMKPWPSEGVVSLLVHKASGQFIYAATILKFVGAEYYRPTSQLDIVLKPTPSHERPFADLDHLYHQVLSTYRDPETLVRVLGAILVLRGCQPPEVIEDILGLEERDLNLVLRGLHSVINFPASEVDTYEGDGSSDEERGLRLFHVSFYDYLVDKDRSRRYYVDLDKYHALVTVLGFELVTKWMSRSQSSNAQRCPRPRTWGYLTNNLSFHFWKSSQEARSKGLETLLIHGEKFSANCPIPKVDFAALHCASSLVEDMLRDHRQLDKPWKYRVNYLDLINQLDEDYPADIDRNLDDELVSIFKLYRSILDTCYGSVLSKMHELNEMINSVPGFLVMMHSYMGVQDIADLLNVSIDILNGHIECNRHFLTFTKLGLVLNHHLYGYLFNKNRSGQHYHDRRSHDIAICMRGLSLTFDHAWSNFEQCRDATGRYLNANFAEHLQAFNIQPSDTTDHPLRNFINYLDQTVFYHPSLYTAEQPTLYHIWFYISKILGWVQRQQKILSDLETPSQARLSKKLESIVDSICRQILCVEATPSGPVVTLCPPLLASIKYQILRTAEVSSGVVSAPFLVPEVEMVDFETKNLVLTGVSNEFLLLENVNPSLKQYLTNASRAQKLYIKEDLFHTRLAEFWLDQLLDRKGDSGRNLIEMSIRLEAGNRCKQHLIRANATEKIFARMRELSSWSFIGFSQPHIDSFRHIIAWLESLDKPPLDVYLQYQKMLLKAEEDDARREAKNQEMVPVTFAQQRPPDITPCPSPALSSLAIVWHYVLGCIGHAYFRLTVLFQFYYLMLSGR